MEMKAVIELDVPEWQIGQDVSVYFPDTMLKHGRCELLKEREPLEPELEGGGSSWWYVCGECHGAIDEHDAYCRHCGRKVKAGK